MRIAKPLLLVTTPIGVVGGLITAWTYVGGLVFLMAMMIGVISIAFIGVVRIIRAESAAAANHGPSREERPRS
jgi:energy-converting hydrogenase Eha subunit H